MKTFKRNAWFSWGAYLSHWLSGRLPDCQSSACKLSVCLPVYMPVFHFWLHNSPHWYAHAQTMNGKQCRASPLEMARPTRQLLVATINIHFFCVFCAGGVDSMSMAVRSDFGVTPRWKAKDNVEMQFLHPAEQRDLRRKANIIFRIRCAFKAELNI